MSTTISTCFKIMKPDIELIWNHIATDINITNHTSLDRNATLQPFDVATKIYN